MTTDLRNLSIAELKKIKKLKQQKAANEYKQKLIDDIKKIDNFRKKSKSKPKPKPKHNPKHITPSKKHLLSIFRIVSRIKQFLQILHLIFANISRTAIFL